MYIKKVLWALALLGLLVFGIIAYFIYGAMFSPNTAFNNNTAYVYIPSGATYADVRRQLEPLLINMSSFDALAKQKAYTTNVKPGRFPIKKGMNNNDIINSIRSQNIPVRVSFNNQKSIKTLAGRVSLQIEADSLSLLEAMNEATFLEVNGFTKETALAMYLPNSYEFFWNTSAKDFRIRMLREYRKFWTEDRIAKAAELDLSPEEVISLASIVYEESKQKTEQPRVAGLYLNRLRIGMPLQADPTLKFAAYQLPEYENTVIRRVLNVHKTIDSPYNTYMNSGLPPGPIVMPDLSAIDAVLNYEKHNYLYMVADKQRLGYHKFASSLTQHNRNAREYQQFLTDQGIIR